MVRPAGDILAGAATKLGKGHGKDLFVEAVSRQVGLEGGHCRRQFAQEGGMSDHLIGMGIKSAQRDKVDPCLLSGGNQASYLLKISSQIALRIFHHGLVIAKPLKDFPLRHQCVHQGVLEEVAIGIVGVFAAAQGLQHA